MRPPFTFSRLRTPANEQPPDVANGPSLGSGNFLKVGENLRNTLRCMHKHGWVRVRHFLCRASQLADMADTAESLCGQVLPDVLKPNLVSKYVTREELHLHCVSLASVFPRGSMERRILQDALLEAFPEWRGHTYVEAIALRLSVLLRLGRAHGVPSLQWVEYFAGESQLTRGMADAGYHSKA